MSTNPVNRRMITMKTAVLLFALPIIIMSSSFGAETSPAPVTDEVKDGAQSGSLIQDIDWTKGDFGVMDHKARTDLFRWSRESFANDPFRPLYHFSPPVGRLHDAAGLCRWQGKFHMFYLLTTRLDRRWARGHSVSDDLVHWRDFPMLPNEIRGGTGQVWADNDRVLIQYMSGGGSSLATACDPLLLEWKRPDNSQIKGKPGSVCIWHEEGVYYTLGGYWPGQRGPAGELFRSKDLTAWESLGLVVEDGHFAENSEDLSCPNFLPIGNGKHLLLFFSHRRGPQYYIGIFDREKGRYAIENHARMNFGPPGNGRLHAPSAFIDQNGRCIAIWNIRFDGSSQQRAELYPWKEILSLPRHLSLNTDASNKDTHPLLIEPIEELKSLRVDPVSIGPVAIPANGEQVLKGIGGKAMELGVEIDPMKASEVGLNILRSPDGKEQTTIALFMQVLAGNSNMRKLSIDASRASLDPKVVLSGPETGPLYLKDGEPLRLRIFIDRSVVEVFANGRQCLTLCTNPGREDSKGVSVFARGSEAKLNSLTAHPMRSIWPELKTQEGK